MAAATITGDKEIDRMFAQVIPREAFKVLRKATRAVTKEMADDAKKRTPKKTGRLRKSIKVRALKKRRGSVGHRLIHDPKEFEGSDVKYYGFATEYGTAHIRPQPALRPAMEKAKRDGPARFRQITGELITKVSRGKKI